VLAQLDKIEGVEHSYTNAAGNPAKIAHRRLVGGNGLPIRIV
jgi:hypothetical protein